MTELLLVGLAVFGYALVSDRLATSPVTAPMVFTAFGLAVGSHGLGWFDLGLDSRATVVLVEATLVLLLFTDAARIDLRVLREGATLPIRMLGVGLPLSFLAGSAAALLVLDDLTIGEAALVGAVLAATDAALGRSVVADRRLPVRIRQAVNVESGLNDGLVLPVVTIALGLAAAESVSADADTWIRFAGEQIGFGLGCGVAIGGLGGWWLQKLIDADHVEGVYRQLATVAVIVMAFAAANELGGNGFIAAFTAGLAFGHTARDHCTEVEAFAEDEGELLSVVTFTVFGAAFAGPAIDQLTWPIVLYSVLSLTVVRVLPVLVALWRSGTLVETRLFLGWFGPRGLATVLFALLVLRGLDSPRTDTVVAVATWTVLLSIFVHGATASPWVARLARRLVEVPEHAPEVASVPELPTRRRGHGV